MGMKVRSGLSMDVNFHDAVIVHSGAHDEIGPPSETVNELDHAMLSKFSPLPGIGDVPKQLFGVFHRQWRTFDGVLFPLKHVDNPCPPPAGRRSANPRRRR